MFFSEPTRFRWKFSPFAQISQRASGVSAYQAQIFKRFLVIATGSCDEMRVWTQYASDLGYIDEAAHRKWRGEYSELANMLRGLADSWK